jgi:hypothetical protein
VALDLLVERVVGDRQAHVLPGLVAQAQDVVVRIRHVGERRQDERDGRGGPSARGADGERDMVLEPVRTHAHGVDAAGEVGGHVEGEVRRPPGVVEVVLPEGDRRVLLGRAAEVHRRAVPGVPGHRPHRPVHQPAVQGGRAGVGDDGALRVAGEIPGREEATVAVAQHGRLELAVEVAVDAGGRDRAGPHQRAGGGLASPAAGRRRHALDAEVGLRQLARERLGAGGDVDPRAHPHPAARRQGVLVARDRSVGIGQPRRQASVRVEADRPARPARRDRLDVPRRRERRPRPDLDLDRVAPQPRTVVYDQARPGVGALGPSVVAPVDRRPDDTLLEPRPVGMLVAVQQLDELRLVGPGRVDAQLELDALARSHAEPVAIAGDLHVTRRRPRAASRAAPRRAAATAFRASGRRRRRSAVR